MAKSKQQKEKAIEALKPLDHDARVEVLTQEGYSEKEQAEVLEALAAHDKKQEEAETFAEEIKGEIEAYTPAEEPIAEAPTPVAEQPKAKEVEQPKAQSGHPRFEQVELYWSEGQLKEGTVIKVVSIEADRAERLNSQSRNTKIRYRPVK